jgi:hypothetical protein
MALQSGNYLNDLRSNNALIRSYYALLLDVMKRFEEAKEPFVFAD